jgi:hypothetical protein
MLHQKLLSVDNIKNKEAAQKSQLRSRKTSV